MTERKTIFVSYSHRDRPWLDRLYVHLKPFERNGRLELWNDEKIAPGAQWRQEIEQAIDRAAASVLLVSADFLASDFVAVHELPRLLKKADRARVLPIIVAPCELSLHPVLAAYQALNSPAEPLAAMTPAAAEQVLTRAVSVIGRLLDNGGAAQQHGGASLRSLAADAPGGRGAPADEAGDESAMFSLLMHASIALSIVWALGQADAGLSMTELETLLDARSRKTLFEGVERLAGDGWIEKSRSSGLTRYRLTTLGARQVERLAAAADGPIRRTLPPR